MQPPPQHHHITPAAAPHRRLGRPVVCDRRHAEQMAESAQVLQSVIWRNKEDRGPTGARACTHMLQQNYAYSATENRAARRNAARHGSQNRRPEGPARPALTRAICESARVRVRACRLGRPTPKADSEGRLPRPTRKADSEGRLGRPTRKAALCWRRRAPASESISGRPGRRVPAGRAARPGRRARARGAGAAPSLKCAMVGHTYLCAGLGRCGRHVGAAR